MNVSMAVVFTFLYFILDVAKGLISQYMFGDDFHFLAADVGLEFIQSTILQISFDVIFFFIMFKYVVIKPLINASIVIFVPWLAMFGYLSYVSGSSPDILLSFTMKVVTLIAAVLVYKVLKSNSRRQRFA